MEVRDRTERERERERERRERERESKRHQCLPSATGSTRLCESLPSGSVCEECFPSSAGAGAGLSSAFLTLPQKFLLFHKKLYDLRT